MRSSPESLPLHLRFLLTELLTEGFGHTAANPLVMRLNRASVVLTISIASAFPAASAPGGGEVVEACYASPAGALPGADARACRTAEQFVKGFGRTCRLALDPATCVTVDGRLISPELVDAYESSWTPRALALQRGLDDGVPMLNELWVHTHNSFNAEAYSPTLSGLDPNHVYSITDQLRMGVRAIEIDVHWAPSLDGLPSDGGKAPIACHGTTESVAGINVHIGCSLEVHVRVRLAEVRAWLLRPENANEVLLVYLENQMDDDPLAHQRATEAISSTLGDLVYRPAGSGCAPLPLDESRGQIRATGARVVLTGDCGPGAWTSWVFERGPRWKEGSNGDEYPDYPACDARERIPNDYDRSWIRTWEDSTWLSAMLDGSRQASTIDAVQASRMVRCGVDMIGFDQLHPFDPRLDAVVWSWAPNQPSGGSCGYAGSDGRFRSDDCSAPRSFACVSGNGAWSVAPAGPWSDGAAACAVTGTTFSVPKSGYANELLKTAASGSEVWLDYRLVGSAWTPEAAG